MNSVISELQRAAVALYAQVPEAVADDVKAKVEAVVTAYREQAAELERLRNNYDKLMVERKALGIQCHEREEETARQFGILADAEKKSRKEAERLRGENYSDLLDQMDEAWGRNFQEIGGAEIRAFLESRIVHKPTTTLREKLQAAEEKIVELEEQS